MLCLKLAVAETAPEWLCSCGEVFLREQRNFCVRCGKVMYEDKDIHEDVPTLMTTQV